MLVAAPERWDEACFVVPAVRALISSGLTVGVICLPEQRDFWKTLPALEVLERPHKAKLLAPMLAGNWKAALLWEDGFAADAAIIAKVPRRLGPSIGKLAKKLTHPLTCLDKPLEHRVNFYLSAVKEMGIPTTNPEFFAPAVIGIEIVRKSVLLSPESDFGSSHEWLPERWLEMARQLIDDGYMVTVAGIGSRRQSMAQALACELGDAVKFEEVSLMNALPMLAAQQWVIAADGSLPHLAAHAGATCITLFGPNDPQWKRPLGRRHAVVRCHVECAPCLLEKCPLDLRCQRELEVDRVWETVAAVFNRQAER